MQRLAHTGTKYEVSSTSVNETVGYSYSGRPGLTKQRLQATAVAFA